jgi:AcrR family transcriptional regulator
MSVIVPPPRVRRRRAAREDRILSVAARSLVRHWPDSVTFDEIASEADVAKGTIHSHFPTKEALLIGIIEPALLALAGALGTIKDDDARDVVVELLDCWVKVLREYHNALKLAHCLDSKLPAPISKLQRRVVAKVQRILARPEVLERLRGSVPWATGVIVKLGIPLFDVYEGIDPTGETFVEAIRYLLLRAKKAHKRPISTKTRSLPLKNSFTRRANVKKGKPNK